jgi:hypothetical protein
LDDSFSSNTTCMNFDLRFLGKPQRLSALSDLGQTVECLFSSDSDTPDTRQSFDTTTADDLISESFDFQ